MQCGGKPGRLVTGGKGTGWGRLYSEEAAGGVACRGFERPVVADGPQQERPRGKNSRPYLGPEGLQLEFWLLYLLAGQGGKFKALVW